MLRIHDDRDRVLNFSRAPTRIVSLVPSDTYSIYALGKSVIARTDYCIEPADVASVPSIGGTKNPRTGDIIALEPDLVIANQEENTKSDLEKLAQSGVRVYVSFPQRVEEGLAHLAKLARILRAEDSARALLKAGYEGIRHARASTARKLRAFCPIWLDPLMTINDKTFISDMMELAGFENVFADRERRYPLAADLGSAPAKDVDRDKRYPRVTLDEVRARSPEIALLPDEPYAFEEKHKALFPVPRSELVSGKDLCWYGAWSVHGLERLQTIARSVPRT